MKNSSPPTSTSKPIVSRVICLRCFKAPSITHIPLDRLGREWHQLVKQAEAEGIECYGFLSVCGECYKAVRRSPDGYIRGYKTFRGKTRQYVEEELLGGAEAFPE